MSDNQRDSQQTTVRMPRSNDIASWRLIYDRWVEAGCLTREQADRQLAVMEGKMEIQRYV